MLWSHPTWKPSFWSGCFGYQVSGQTATFWGPRSCEVAIIWPAVYTTAYFLDDVLYTSGNFLSHFDISQGIIWSIAQTGHPNHFLQTKSPRSNINLNLGIIWILQWFCLHTWEGTPDFPKPPQRKKSLQILLVKICLRWHGNYEKKYVQTVQTSHLCLGDGHEPHSLGQNVWVERDSPVLLGSKTTSVFSSWDLPLLQGGIRKPTIFRSFHSLPADACFKLQMYWVKKCCFFKENTSTLNWQKLVN